MYFDLEDYDFNYSVKWPTYDAIDDYMTIEFPDYKTAYLKRVLSFRAKRRRKTDAEKRDASKGPSGATCR